MAQKCPETLLERVVEHLDRQLKVSTNLGTRVTTALLYVRQFTQSLLPEEQAILNKLKDLGDKLGDLTKTEDNAKEEVSSRPEQPIASPVGHQG